MRRTRLNIVPPSAKPATPESHMKTVSSNAVSVMTHVNSDAVESNAQVPAMMTMASNIVEAPLIKESRTSRVKWLQEEAKNLAREQVTEFESMMEAVAHMAEDIADGGDAYHVGVREFCRRMSEEMPRNIQTLQAILKKI